MQQHAWTFHASIVLNIDALDELAREKDWETLYFDLFFERSKVSILACTFIPSSIQSEAGNAVEVRFRSPNGAIGDPMAYGLGSTFRILRMTDHVGTGTVIRATSGDPDVLDSKVAFVVLYAFLVRSYNALQSFELMSELEIFSVNLLLDDSENASMDPSMLTSWYLLAHDWPVLSESEAWEVSRRFLQQWQDVGPYQSVQLVLDGMNHTDTESAPTRASLELWHEVWMESVANAKVAQPLKAGSWPSPEGGA